MIPIAYHAGGYLAQWGKQRPVKVVSLKAYGEDHDVLARRMEITFGSTEKKTASVLVSVNSSGRLVRDVILPLMKRIGIESPTSVALARTPNSPDFALRALSVLSDDFTRYTPEDCPACAKGRSTAILIQHDSYLLDLAAYTRENAITRRGAELARCIVERYSGIDAFRVHRTHTDGRHHAFFIDLVPMLKQSAFKTRLANTVAVWRGVNVDLILHPEHTAAAQLASMVARELGVADVVSCDDGTLGRIQREKKEMLVRARSICVVDDVVISGARVFGYRTAINAIRRDRGVGNCDLYCLVGVARPTNEKALLGVSDIVHHTKSNPRFLSVECLFLPNWNESECRWCAERERLEKLPPGIRDGAVISERLEKLRDHDGLVRDLFAPWTGKGHRQGSGGRQARGFWELGPGSVFGAVQQADLAVSVAASIQRMRGMRKRPNGTWEDSKLDERFQSPVAKILDPRFYLAGRYYEPVIVASILRATRAHDVRSPGDDSSLRSRVEIVASAETSTELHGELMLAAALGQLPRVSYRISKAHPEVAAASREILTS